jgi:hypothetical protein
MKRLFSSSFAAYGTPSNLAVSLYTTAKAPLPIQPTLLYFVPPRHSRICLPEDSDEGFGVAGPVVGKRLSYDLSVTAKDMYSTYVLDLS